MRKLHDRYFKQAKREGHLARSIYKLEELDRRNQLLRPGDRVLDLGACPGSWLEYILPKVGPRGVVCAVDLKAIHKKFKGKVCFRKKDIQDVTPADFADVAEQFDVIVSDMAPSTSGIKSADQARSLGLCETAYSLAEQRLAPRGHFVCKILDGPEVTGFRARLREAFDTVKLTKPDASRDESMEAYFVCKGFRGGARD